MYKKILFITIIITIAFYSYSKEKPKDYDILTNIKIPEHTEKKFFLVIPKYPKSNIISYKSRVNIIRDYLDKTLVNDKNDANIYIFKCSFQVVKLYKNYTIEKRINCVMIAKAVIKIYSNKNILLLKLYIYSRSEKIIDDDSEIEIVKEELLNESFSAFLTKLNDNENFKNFIKEESYNKIDDSNKLKNKIEPWKELLIKNKNDYKLLFSIGYAIDYGGYFSLVNTKKVPFGTLGKFCFEIYPVDIFSIEYQFDIGSLLFGLLYNGIYKCISIQINNDLNFSFNFLNTAFCCQSTYFIIGYHYNYFTGENSLTEYIYKPGKYHIENRFTQNTHLIKIGLGYKFFFRNPYIDRSDGSCGFEISYMPSYNDYFKEWHHGINLSFIIKSNWYIHVFKEKPGKYVSKKYFQVR